MAEDQILRCRTAEDRFVLASKIMDMERVQELRHGVGRFPHYHIIYENRRMPIFSNTIRETYIPLETLEENAKALQPIEQSSHRQKLGHILRARMFFTGFQKHNVRSEGNPSGGDLLWSKSEMKKTVEILRRTTIRQGLVPLTIYFLMSGDYYLKASPFDDPKTYYPFDDYTTDREPYWKEALDEEPWIIHWWVYRCVGRVVNIHWIWQDIDQPDEKLNELKATLQVAFRKCLIKLLDSTYVNIIDKEFDKPTEPFCTSPAAQKRMRKVEKDLGDFWTSIQLDLRELPVLTGDPTAIKSQGPSIWDECVNRRAMPTWKASPMEIEEESRSQV